MAKEKRQPRFDFSTLHDPVSNQTARRWASEAGQTVVHALILEEVIEDPDNPRTQFDDEGLTNLAASIADRGVQQPIIVREKDASGRYIIIHGARRYRASRIANQSTIPALIIRAEEMGKYDDYSQVVENIQRENLSALDIASFISKRLAAGDKKSEIAARLGVQPKYVTLHSSLLDCSSEVLDLFKSGRINGVETFYDLTRLQTKSPEAATKLLTEVASNPFAELTQATIRAAIAACDKPVQVSTTINPVATDAELIKAAMREDPVILRLNESQEFTKVGSDEIITAWPNSVSTDADLSEMVSAAETPVSAQVIQLPYHNPKSDSDELGDGRIQDPSKIRKPLLLGRVDGEPVKILLSRKPTTPGLAHIEWEMTGIVDEIDIGRITLTLLGEMKVSEIS